MTTLLIKVLSALLLDRLLGEPVKWHPLKGFGRWAQWIEALARHSNRKVASGTIAWMLSVLSWVGLAFALKAIHPAIGWSVDIAPLYFALGGRSLDDHAKAVVVALKNNDLERAQRKTARMVSRETQRLDASGVARATTESVLENGNDAVFATLFWFCLLGGPGALLFRLANTLDAMWGYRTPRYLHFGRAAAFIDDVLGWLPARLTALTYALLGNTRNALRCWRQQAPHWDSPNAGPVMTSGAGALSVELGGSAIYHGIEESRPRIGNGYAPDVHTIERALCLVRIGTLLWLSIMMLGIVIQALVT